MNEGMHTGLQKKEMSRWGLKGSSKITTRQQQEPNLEPGNVPVISLNKLQRKTGREIIYATARNMWGKDRDTSSLPHPGYT